MPGPGCSGSMITAAPTLCSAMKRAASRSVRPGVIVRTFSVIASRTFTAPTIPGARGSRRFGRMSGTKQAAVRAGNSADIPAVLALWAAARSANASTPVTPESLERLLATDAGALLVAERDGAIVGALIAAWDGWRGGMYRLAVDPAPRREGIATALGRAGGARPAGRGAPRIPALVAHEDADAVALWGAVGYTHDRTIARFVR